MTRLVWHSSPSPDCALSWTQWSRIRRLPDTILFSSRAPAGMSILSPWFAMMMTVPWGYRKETRVHKLVICVDVERGNRLSGGAVRCQLYQSLNAFICIVSAYRNIGGVFGSLFSPEQRF